MLTQINLGEITADVILKDIKNIHLSVHPPAGRVRISAPARLSLEAIRAFALSRLEWIRRQQERVQAQERETRREYLDRESHFVWGKRYLLRVIEQDRAPGVELQHGWLLLRVRPGADTEKKRAVVETWYRALLREALPPLIGKWEPLLGVRVERFFVQRMKTKWGSCNPQACSIRLNSELAKKPRLCLEYVVVHEMAHLIEPRHNARFVALLDRSMPQWRLERDRLNQLPVGHEEWDG